MRLSMIVEDAAGVEAACEVDIPRWYASEIDGVEAVKTLKPGQLKKLILTQPDHRFVFVPVDSTEIIAEYERLRVRADWQNIETAPKGVPVLISNPLWPEPSIGIGILRDENWHSGSGWYDFYKNELSVGRDLGPEFQPALWRELPKRG